VQIVGYETAVPETEEASLLFASRGDVRRETLVPGTRLAYRLDERRCGGTLEDGEHIPCERETAPSCDRHASRWACARCTGKCDLPLATCREEHAVYLAAFAPATFKVGVTRSWRLRTRLREQGADRGAHIRTVPDGRVARRIEADIAETVGDSVRVREKIRGLGRPVDDTAWDGLLAGFDPIETYNFEYNLGLSGRPVAETLATGTVRGTKGRVLVLAYNGSTYAVDLRGLVGYHVEAGEAERSLQSSFAAFE